MYFTGFESVVLATVCTGEETVCPLAGVQMVTEGFTLLRVHPLLEVPVPDSPALCGLLLAESVSVRVPARVPEAVGAKVTLTLQMACAARLLPQSLVCAKSPATEIEVNVTATLLLLVT